MAASIAPLTLGQPAYTISGSHGVVADLTVNFLTNVERTFAVTCPFGANVELIARPGAGQLSYAVGTAADGQTLSVGNRDVLVDRSGAVAGVETFTITATATSAAASETWEWRMSSPTPVNWTVTAMQTSVSRVLADPSPDFTVTALDGPAPGTVPPSLLERQNVKLGANGATYVGAPAPTVYYRWQTQGGPPIPSFEACGVGLDTKTFQVPGVYTDNQSVTLELDLWYDAACPLPTAPPPGICWGSSSRPFSIKPRPQRLALVLDRSGSMSGDRWNNAVIGAQLLIDLFYAVRGERNSGDRIEVRIFEGLGSWGTPVTLPTADNLPLTPPKAAAAKKPTFGAPGTSTPIGDGLVAAMNDLQSSGVGDEPHFTIVLMTDGYENCGKVVVEPGVSLPGVIAFSAARAQVPLDEVNNRLDIYAIGLGGAVQDKTLNGLPWPHDPDLPADPKYRNVLDVRELAGAMGQVVSYSTQARPFAPSAPVNGVPNSTKAQYFSTETGVRVVAAAVLWTPNSGNTLALRRWDGAAWAPVAGKFTAYNEHGFIWFDRGDQTSAADWQIIHTNAAGEQTIKAADLLLYKDLETLADASFDKREYRTGEPIGVEVRARTGSEVVSGLEVVVELARPGQSLGTYLVTQGTGWQPGQGGGGDPLPPKADMLQYALRRSDRNGLETIEPKGFFVDGSNQLWEDKRPHAAGNYVNTYAKTDVEGTYTFRFYVHGKLADGSPFSQVMTHSVWVGVLPSPGNSTVTTTALAGGQLQVTVVPRDAGGQYLGPFWTGLLDFKTTSGTWTGPVVDHYDGSYSRILRLEGGTAPTVSVVVDGVPLTPVIVATGLVGDIIGWLQRLCKKVVRFVLKVFGRRPNR